MTHSDPDPANPFAGKPSHRLRAFFERPLFLSLTIGVPFCIFKLLFGIVAIQIGTGTYSVLTPAGWFIVAWAGVDLLMNSGRILLDISGREAGFEYCSIAQAGRLVHKPRVFLAIDTFLTFGIICAMLWSGWIARLTPLESYFWYAATTLNLISLSLVSLYHEIRD